MANSLTGDFPAIFQVSRGTINRLLASMHQNDWSDRSTPSFPHSVELRLDEGEGLEAVTGTARAQLGVPRIELLHGSTDRFRLRVGVRAHYEPDYWTAPLAEFIHGTLTAEYVLTQADPSWPGWSEAATSEYVAIRLVEGSVSFSGSVANGWGWGDSFPPDPEATLPLVTNQIAELLRTSFQATPVRAPRFAPGKLRSVQGPGGGWAVAGPIDLGTDAVGRLESIEEEWLEGRDVGVALSSDFVLSRLERVLAGLGTVPPVTVDYGLDTTVYRVAISASRPEWRAFGNGASITLRISGSATTDSVLPDVDVEVVQTVDVGFHPASGSLTLAAGQRTVTSRLHTLSVFSDLIEPAINSAVDAQVRAQIGPPLESASSAFNGFLAGDLLGAELRKLDRFLTLRLDEGIFRPEGIAVRGTIKVTPRSQPSLTFAPTGDRSAFTALETWIPGGQVNKLSWTWERPISRIAVMVEVLDEAEPWEAEHKDRFLLRGPLRYSEDPVQLPWHTSLPGLEGKGGVILSVEAVAVDERSGELVPIETFAKAIGFGYTFPWELPPWVGDLHWTEDMGLLTRRKRPRPDDLSLGVLRRPTANARPWSTNTLIVTQGRGVTLETLATVERGLTDHGRLDAGLLTVTVLGEGESSRAEPDVLRELGRLENELATPLLVVEAVGSVLSDGLALPSDTSEPSYRLISPGGGVTWKHDGSLSPAELTTALNSALMSSPPPVPEMTTGGPAAGTRLWEAVSGGVALPEGERRPAPPLGRHADGPDLAMFVDSRSTASIEQIRNLEQRGAAGVNAAARVTVFVNGDLEDVRALNSQLAGTVDAIPDPGGAIAGRLGVSCWPTTVMLDERGAVIDSWVGADAASLDSEDLGSS